MAIYLYAGLLGLMYLGLSYNVILKRLRLKIGLGDGGNATLQRAIRIHSNFAEYIPLALIFLHFAQKGGADSWVIHTLGSLLIVSRGLHAWGLGNSSGASPGRFAGTVGTHAVIAIAALLCLWAYFT